MSKKDKLNGRYFGNGPPAPRLKTKPPPIVINRQNEINMKQREFYVIIVVGKVTAPTFYDTKELAEKQAVIIAKEEMAVVFVLKAISKFELNDFNKIDLTAVCDVCDSTTDKPTYKLCDKHYSEYENKQTNKNK